eukprot:6690027-Pyramimonas_sp.AAC.2
MHSLIHSTRARFEPRRRHISLPPLTRLVLVAGIFSLPSRDWSSSPAYSPSPHAIGPRATHRGALLRLRRRRAGRSRIVLRGKAAALSVMCVYQSRQLWGVERILAVIGTGGPVQ